MPFRCRSNLRHTKPSVQSFVPHAGNIESGRSRPDHIQVRAARGIRCYTQSGPCVTNDTLAFDLSQRNEARRDTYQIETNENR